MNDFHWLQRRICLTKPFLSVRGDLFFVFARPFVHGERVGVGIWEDLSETGGEAAHALTAT